MYLTTLLSNIYCQLLDYLIINVISLYIDSDWKGYKFSKKNFNKYLKDEEES